MSAFLTEEFVVVTTFNFKKPNKKQQQQIQPVGLKVTLPLQSRESHTPCNAFPTLYKVMTKGPWSNDVENDVEYCVKFLFLSEKSICIPAFTV